MKKVLFVAYIFPPTATTGVHRSAKFVQYLPEYGWQPIVLTSANCTYPGRDPNSADEIPPVARIEAISAIESEHVKGAAHKLLKLMGLEERVGRALDWRLDRLYERMNFPDIHAPWAKRAIGVARRICASENVDAVLTTSWPYSDHLVGLQVSKEFGIPWVADFRDPWLDNSAYHREISSQLGRREVALEDAIVHNADAVVCTAANTADAFRVRYRDIPPRQFRLVRNGFDPHHVRLAPPPSDGPLRIGYVGAFYRDRAPTTLAAALNDLKEDGIISPDMIEVLLIGDIGNAWTAIERQGVREFFRAVGRVPSRECYPMASECHVLWLLQHEDDGFAVPGKTYEYLATNRWILGSVPLNSEVAAILSDAGDCATLVAPDDVSATAHALKQLLERHRQGSLKPTYNAGYVEQFSRQAQTGKMAQILNELTEREEAPDLCGPSSR